MYTDTEVNKKQNIKITISGLGGVGKGTVARLIAEKLNLKYLSGGDFFRSMAKDLNLTVYEFDQFVKKNPKYDFKLDEMQQTYGKKNINFILESRLGWYFIPDSIKIRLDCEENERLRRLSERDGLDIKILKKKEVERYNSVMERYKKLYKIDDFLNIKNYDLSIDTTELTPKEIVDKILTEIKNIN